MVAANLAPSWPANDRAQLAKVLVAVLDANHVHYDLWVGTFTSNTKAWHRDRLVRKHLAPADWLVVADVDELHQFPGVPAHGAAPPPGSHSGVRDWAPPGSAGAPDDGHSRNRGSASSPRAKASYASALLTAKSVWGPRDVQPP